MRHEPDITSAPLTSPYMHTPPELPPVIPQHGKTIAAKKLTIITALQRLLLNENRSVLIGLQVAGLLAVGRCTGSGGSKKNAPQSWVRLDSL